MKNVCGRNAVLGSVASECVRKLDDLFCFSDGMLVICLAKELNHC